MAFDGSGTYSRVHNWVTDRDAGTVITASRMDAEDDSLVTALNLCLLKDGQQDPTASLPMAGFKHTGGGEPAARGEYLTVASLQDGKTNWVDGTGTADAITATYSPVITAVVDGMLCFVRATAASSMQ